jgi:adenosine deaminase
MPETQRRSLPSFASFEEFSSYIFDADDAIRHTKAKELAIALLQTESNLREATRGIIVEASVDRVVYLELTVCPLYHLKNGLTPEQVLDAILDEVNLSKDRGIRVSIVLNANIEKLSPLELPQVAQMCVAYKGRGVVGFATTTAEISVADMRFFEPTFEFLRQNFVPVTVFAGEANTESVPCALVRGHARRIAGGFQITESEALLNDVTAHNVTVLVALSRRMDMAVSGWKKSPVRFFFDFGVHIAFASIHHSLQKRSRSQQLFEIAEQAGFDAISLIRVMDNTFRAAFLPYKDTSQYQRMFWEKSTEILKENGFSATMNYSYFPTG